MLKQKSRLEKEIISSVVLTVILMASGWRRCTASLLLVSGGSSAFAH